MMDKVRLESKLESVGKKLKDRDCINLISKDLALASLRTMKFANMMNKEN
ncbi:hypothetical protein K5V21_06135 [Clostridium sardiniense]|uniref:Uncharacterized protein n=1 Tax=Clostridium sardiniense TaxID=29369 RepID=A0ABS7KW48_CLOSR|nr:hypothetical protein [Clostridium sardiniense]MBY0755033.1 hypothetical protein [Clostridium sardiniense]MDQ0459112.1 hypothetical protein [Clostridium sardiniense]